MCCQIVDLKITFSPSTTNAELAAPPTISQPSTPTAVAATTECLTIRTIELSLPPLRSANANFADHVECRNVNKAHLDNFYNGKQFRYKRYKRMSKEARAEEFHRLADSLLRMVGDSIGERKEEDKVVIEMGVGRFTSTSRLSSLHGTFESFFIQKARTLGYLIVGVHKYYTSKRCPNRCKKYMHRDIMAGHNIVNILRSHVEQQQRPLYLQPVDKDDQYPWLERGCEIAARPKDAPISLKQVSSNGSRAGRADRKRQAEEDGDADKGKDSKRTKATMAKQKATTTKSKMAAAKQMAMTLKGKAIAMQVDI
ncbi:hypothetical protein BGZ47_007241 [Haplosporangium gracile]|nr:hypothetical protein BGZ47_007241 [Haplosporangium gracile]